MTTLFMQSFISRPNAILDTQLGLVVTPPGYRTRKYPEHAIASLDMSLLLSGSSGV